MKRWIPALLSCGTALTAFAALAQAPARPQIETKGSKTDGV